MIGPVARTRLGAPSILPDRLRRLGRRLDITSEFVPPAGAARIPSATCAAFRPPRPALGHAPGPGLASAFFFFATRFRAARSGRRLFSSMALCRVWPRPGLLVAMLFVGVITSLAALRYALSCQHRPPLFAMRLVVSAQERSARFSDPMLFNFGSIFLHHYSSVPSWVSSRSPGSSNPIPPSSNEDHIVIRPRTAAGALDGLLEARRVERLPPESATKPPARAKNRPRQRPQNANRPCFPPPSCGRPRLGSRVRASGTLQLVGTGRGAGSDPTARRRVRHPLRGGGETRNGDYALR